MINYLKHLTSIPGISGHENLVRDYIKNEILKIGNYEVKYDGLGSIFAYKKSKNKDAKTVMIAGHMDEVGFIVSDILDNGVLLLENVGGINLVNYQGLKLNVYYQGDNYISGVVLSVPPHLKHLASIENKLLLDVGATTRDEVLEFGVQIGNMVQSDPIFTETFNKENIITRAADNRFGCALALACIKKFSNKDLDYHLVIGTTVQEEVGLRGAEASANLFKPDIFIALDASPVIDALDNSFPYKLNNGFLMRMYDPRNILMKEWRDYLINLANENDIKFQNFVSFGGTDAAKVIDFNKGIVTTTIGIPARYIHAPAAIINKNDLLSAQNMLYALLNDLNDYKIKEIIKENG